MTVANFPMAYVEVEANSHEFQYMKNNVGYESGAIAGFSTGLMPIVFGQDANISVQLYCYVDANASSSGTHAELSDVVLDWAGFTLYDDTGVPLTGAAVSSASGTGYPVPEPATAAVLGAAAAGLLRRKGKAATPRGK